MIYKITVERENTSEDKNYRSYEEIYKQMVEVDPDSEHALKARPPHLFL